MILNVMSSYYAFANGNFKRLKILSKNAILNDSVINIFTKYCEKLGCFLFYRSIKVRVLSPIAGAFVRLLHNTVLMRGHGSSVFT